MRNIGFVLLPTIILGSACHHRRLTTSSNLKGILTSAEQLNGAWVISMQLPPKPLGEKWTVKFFDEQFAQEIRESEDKVVVQWSVSMNRFSTRKPFRLSLSSSTTIAEVLIEIPVHPAAEFGLTLASHIIIH